jgi:hypothetical protein
MVVLDRGNVAQFPGTCIVLVKKKKFSLLDLFLKGKLQVSVADPDLGSGALWTPGPGMGKIQIWDPESRINVLDHISESLVKIFWLDNKYLNSLLRIRILDPVPF